MESFETRDPATQRRLVALAFALIISACSGGSDETGGIDAGGGDAGATDTGGSDTGEIDTGSDANDADAGGGPSATRTFAYTTNRNDGALSIFVVDPDTGNLSHQGYHAVSAIEDVELHPSGAFLFAASGDRVHGFEIDVDAGGLTAINDLPTGGTSARAMELNASGTVAYVADRSADTISVFGIDTTTGALSSMGSVSTGDNPVDIRIHPSGMWLYSVNRDDRDISVFPVNADGSLGASSSVHTDSSNVLAALAFTPAGDVAYVTVSESNDNVRRFTVNSDTGVLTFVETVSAGRQPVDIELNAAGTYAYTANSDSNNVTVLSVAADGALTSVQTIPAGDSPYRVHFGPGGDALYVGNLDSSDVSIYSVAADGRLTRVDDVRTRDGVSGIAIREGNGTVEYGTERLYVPHPEDSAVYVFDVESGGGGLGTPELTEVGLRPMNVAFHPSGAYAYVVNGDSFDVHAFSVDSATDALNANGVTAIAGFADMLLTRIAIDPSGRFLYVIDNRQGLPGAGRMFLFDINANGTLTYNNAINGTSGLATFGDNPENVIIHPAGRYMVVMNSFGDNITLFEIDEDDGDVTQRQTVSGLDRPLHAAIHPNGRWIYVTVQNENALYKYTMSDDNAFLVSQQVSTQQSVPPAETSHVVVHPSGDLVYLTARDNTISWYTVDRSNGALTYVDMISVDEGPEWLAITPDGRHAYGVSNNGVQRFSIDPLTGAISHEGLTDLANLGTFQRSLTLDNVRQ